VDRRREEVVTRDAELTRLQNEVQRLEAAIGRSEQQAENTQFASQKDIRTKIADNQKRISDIDSQFSKSLLENQKRISQIDGQLARAQLELQYQELRAPVAGEVFDLQPKAPGFVVRETEPLLKLVRDAKLEASVLIQNQDIALVLDALRKNQEEGKKGVPVEVMVEAFPATEFGTVNGILTSVGSDVLEPDPQKGQNFYAFPATIELDSDKFILDNGLQVRLHSGMAVQAKVKIGKRTVLQLFISRLTNQTRGLETVK
jgi:HlyD family secretion protein